MKILSLFILSGVMLVPAALAKKGAEYPATYAGGSLPLGRHKVRATLDNDEVVFEQRGRRIAVPVRNITEISYGTAVRRRMGAAVLDVVPLVHLGEAESRYIGVSWLGARGDRTRAQVLLKLSRTDYNGLLAALERATGIKAVDTNQVPTVVHYEI